MRSFVAALLLLSQAKENPRFEAWKNFKAGSWVKMKVETIEDGEKVLSEETETVVSIAATKIMVERKSTTNFDGKPFTTTEKEEIEPTSAAITKVEKGNDEEIEVAGKKLSCRVVLVTKKPVDSSGEIRHKLWMNGDVPGGMARSESTSLRTNRTVATAVAIGWEKK